VCDRKHLEARSPQQQTPVLLALVFCSLSDQNHVGACSPCCGEQVSVTDPTDHCHVRLRCDHVMKHVEQQWGHFPKEDPNGLQRIALELAISHYRTRGGRSNGPLGLQKVHVKTQAD
jgi:hypothetical protein